MRKEAPGEVALYYHSETVPVTPMYWDEFGPAVRTLATRLRELGVKPGDRVASTLPNIPQAVIAMLATTSIGAIWTSVSPDFGWRGVLDRFRQLQPTVLICTGGYNYNGKAYDRSGELKQIVDDLTCLEHVIYLPFGDVPAPADDAKSWPELLGRRTGGTGGVHVSPRTVRDAALDLVLKRHHRTAEGHHPQPRRHPARAAEAAAAEHEPVRRRRAVLLHHHRVDDVELHGQLAGARGEAAAVRREPRLPGAGRAVADGRRGEGDAVRRVARLRGHARQAGRRPEGQVRPVGPGVRDAGRLPGQPRGVRLVLPERQAGPVAARRLRRHRRVRRVHRRVADAARATRASTSTATSASPRTRSTTRASRSWTRSARW